MLCGEWKNLNSQGVQARNAFLLDKKTDRKEPWHNSILKCVTFFTL